MAGEKVRAGTFVTRNRGKPQVKKEKVNSWTKARRELFLTELAATCNVTAALRKVGKTSGGLYALRRRSAEFRTEWDAALAEGYAKLEIALLDRAINGTVKPVFQAGKKVGEITEYSDAVAMRLLTAHREAAGRSAPMVLEDLDTVRRRVELRLSVMHERIGGKDD